MKKSEWTETPFDTIEQAHELAEKIGLSPGQILAGQNIKYFLIWEGRTLRRIAQRFEEGNAIGPVLEKATKKAKTPPQDPSAPRFGVEDRLLTGPWTPSDYATLSEVRAHYKELGPGSKHRIVFSGEVLIIEYPDKDVYEYRQSHGLVESRALQSAKGRYLEAYEDRVRVGSWALCEYASSSLEVVTDYWKSEFVNFDNVEVLEVTLYRIGQNEYEYVVDKNTGEVWSRKLSAVKKK